LSSGSRGDVVGGVLSRVPTPELASSIELLWQYDGSAPAAAHHVERVLPNGRFQIIIDLTTGDASISGLRSRAVTIDTAAIGPVVGVVFKPGGARGFVDVPSNEFFDERVPLDAVWGSRCTMLNHRLSEAVTAQERLAALESALLEARRGAADDRFALHPCVADALAHLRRLARMRTVSDISREVGVSRRRLSQLFDEQVGMTPKLYCRLLRFRDVVRRIAAGGRIDWADVAAAGGYYDQAHLAHEFREF